MKSLFAANLPLKKEKLKQIEGVSSLLAVDIAGVIWQKKKRCKEGIFKPGKGDCNLPGIFHFGKWKMVCWKGAAIMWWCFHYCCHAQMAYQCLDTTVATIFTVPSHKHCRCIYLSSITAEMCFRYTPFSTNAITRGHLNRGSEDISLDEQHFYYMCQINQTFTQLVLHFVY